TYAAAEGTGHATNKQITSAVETLVEMGPDGRRRMFDGRRADIIVAGAVILESVMRHLGIVRITRTDRGLRDGILVDLMQRQASGYDGSLEATAVAMGRRFYFDERHSMQVAKFSLSLFDDLAGL